MDTVVSGLFNGVQKLFRFVITMVAGKYIQFSKLIKAGGHLKEFNFLRHNSPEGSVYEIDVADEKSDRFAFKMRRGDLEWEISAGPIPEWIIDSKLLLESAIEEQEMAV